MKSKKRKILYLALFLVFCLIAYVIAITGDAGGTLVDAAQLDIDNMVSQIGTIQVTEQPDPKPLPEDLNQLHEKLKEEFNNARNERQKDDKVSENTKNNATKISDKIASKYTSYANESEEKGKVNAAKFYKKSTAHNTLLTKIYMQDKLTSKDVKKINKSSDELQSSFDKALNEVDASSLTPAQRIYLQNRIVPNFQKILSGVKGLIEKMNSIISELTKSATGGGIGGFMKKVSSGGGELGFAKSIMGFLQSFMKNTSSNIQSVTKLIQA